MKQKDILLIIVVAFISTVISIAASKILISPAKNQKQKVEVVEPISATFNAPDKSYFNDQSVDPTQLITIGNSANPQPFNGAQH
ncbi:MAG TPA: hypothetical protein VLF90_04815 [Patescibacteria group bacterium]|nr:hypothetical protein [Patescibacteria group bacterium]